MAMDIISKDKKEIQWKGLPRTSLNDIEELKVGLEFFFSFFIFALASSCIFRRSCVSVNMVGITSIRMWCNCRVNGLD